MQRISPATEPAGLRRTATEDTARPRFWPWLSAAGLLIAVLLVANGKLLQGKAYPQWDAADFFGPSYSLVADHARAHRLLTWNPWTSGGSPDFAEPEQGTSSPVMLLTALIFRKPSGFVAYWMLIWIGGALGVLVFARHLRCPAWGALVAALGFAASGFIVGHAEHTSSLFSIAFLPWICWRLDDALLRARYWIAVQAGVLYGLSALGGYPQFTILTPGFLVLWTIGRIFFADTVDGGTAFTSRGRVRVVPAIIALVLVGIVGVLILCPPYLGFMTETHGYSDRVGPRSRIESISSNILPAEAIATLASPYLFLLSCPGLPERLWANSDISMCSIYSGAVVTVMGVLALLRRSRWRYWLGLMAIVYLCCSLGNQLPLRGWLYDYMPLTRYFRNASMFSVYSIFLLCILAALAARDLEKAMDPEGTEARGFVVLSIVAASAAAIAFFMVTRQVQVRPWTYDLALIHVWIVWLWVVLAGFLLVLRVASVRRFAQILVAIAVLDASLAIVIDRPALYTSATAGWWKEMDHKHVASLDLTHQGFARQLNSPADFTIPQVPNNRNVPLKIPVLNSYAPLTNRFASLPEFALGENRIWFSQQVVKLAPSDFSYAKFTDAVHLSRSPVLLLHNPEQMEALSFRKNVPPTDQAENSATVANLDQVQPASPAAVDLLSYLPDFLQFRYQAPTDGWLMITDRWAPGWKAEVNGNPEPVYGADFLFRAVKVQAGMNIVTLHYAPRTWAASIIISWGTLLLFLICEATRIGRKLNHGLRLRND
jgi:hypothetical protein